MIKMVGVQYAIKARRSVRVGGFRTMRVSSGRCEVSVVESGTWSEK